MYRQLFAPLRSLIELSIPRKSHKRAPKSDQTRPTAGALHCRLPLVTIRPFWPQELATSQSRGHRRAVRGDGARQSDRLPSSQRRTFEFRRGVIGEYPLS
jgi:hypothetical protein